MLKIKPIFTITSLAFGMCIAINGYADNYQMQNPGYSSNNPYQNSSYPNQNAYQNSNNNQNYRNNSYQDQENRGQRPTYYQYQTDGTNYSYQGQGQHQYDVADSSTTYGANTSHDSSVTDQELTKKIHDKLSSGFFSKGYTQVTAQVNNGLVTLQGSVKNWDDKDKLEKEIRNMDGVKGVNSQIQIQDPTSKEPARAFPQDTAGSSVDEQLNKKIRDKVSRGWLWDSYKDVTLNTTDGVVTLEGGVDKLSDQQKLMTEIQKVDGVQQVKSNLKIKNR